jgi:hypothetical protein
MMNKTIGIVIVLATLFLFSFSVSADEIQIRIEGGMGFKALVYNPFNTTFNATFNVTHLFTHKPIEDDLFTTIPYVWSGPITFTFGFAVISAKVVALDKTAIRNGVILGPFVIFGPYINESTNMG